MLTLWYLPATWIQSRSLSIISTNLKKQIGQKKSVTYYCVQDEGNGTAMTPASSELCSNYARARIADSLHYDGSCRGAAICPRQNLHLGSWISFPQPTNLIPFEIGPHSSATINENEIIHLLLEADLMPARANGYSTPNRNILLIEHFGKPIAWKVDSRIAIVLESDINRFTELIMSSFMRKCFVINDCLPLIRIESVSIEGQPQPFESIKSHSKKQLITRNLRFLSAENWDRHISGLRSFSILASQAFEFEYHKNRTEGKTGIVKPDLIPSNNIDDDIKAASNGVVEDKKSKQKPNDGQNGNVMSLNIATTSQNIALNKPTKKISPRTSPLKLIPEVDAKVQKPQEIEPNKPNIAKETADEHANNVVAISSTSNDAPRPTLVRSKGSILASKPPNVLVYSDSAVTRDSVIATLKSVLEENTYTIYPLTAAQVVTRIWKENTTLLVVCGYVNADISAILSEYFFEGGKLLSLCSDILPFILPLFRSHGEIREQELVDCSYSRWNNVKMMHHIFCYQASPVKKHFSTDSDEMPQILQKKPSLVYPRSIEVMDAKKSKYNVNVRVLGTEETWNTPIFVLGSIDSGGKAIFSQVHLEADPNTYESDESNYELLKKYNNARIEILTDLLSAHLGVVVLNMDGKDKAKVYTSAFFLGDHKFKYNLLDRLKSKMSDENTIKNTNLTFKFCGRGVEPPKPTEFLLPILVNSCPGNFQTVDYYNILQTDKIGRLAIYAPIMANSMYVITGVSLEHGLAVIPRQQTNGIGRGGNQWLSPEGCAMFSLQLHIGLSTPLGQKIPLVQHLIATAIVNAIITIEGYENLDIRLKWPNDIYANGHTKIAGILCNSQIESSQAICNIGCGINLSNSTPTTCINDVIKDYNNKHNAKLEPLQYENLLALIFNQIESIYLKVQSGNLDYLYKLYCKLWLHSNAEVTIIDRNGHQKVTQIVGIDEYGFLLVQKDGERPETVHPDGNSFDMLRGLIVPNT